MAESYDISGWATKSGIRCADGRTIMPNAFADQNGAKVPVVYNHMHDDIKKVLGHAILENRNGGVYAYVSFNDTPEGRHAKETAKHGDITQFSIYANQLKENRATRQVYHGCIRELSLVLAGANPGAVIDTIMAHNEGTDDETEEAFIFHGDEGEIEIFHSEEKATPAPAESNNDKGEEDMAAEDKSMQDIIDTMTEEQKDVMYALVGEALEAGEDEDYDDDEYDDEYDEYDDDYEDDDMKHNIFYSDMMDGSAVITHSDQEAIMNMAKQGGSFKDALGYYLGDDELAHDAIANGFAEANISKLFPEYEDLRKGEPELITSDQGWISVVLNKVHKSPMSRVRTRYVDIRNIDTLRAKGYQKGKQKGLTGNFQLVRRETDPQTIYVKSALHRDDIVDITDFDYVNYLYKIDKMQLNEELATAILFGDGREAGAEGKISEEHIRPIYTDDELYTMHVELDIEAARSELQGSDTSKHFGENYVTAEAFINTLLYAREKFKGSGTPDLYITPHMLNVMLLARDLNGRRIYSSKAELASALNVNSIITVEQMEGKTRTKTVTVSGVSSNKTMQCEALVMNLSDYNIGSTKGGEVTHFTQFDIDFNQQKSLLETRVSGANTRVYSAIAIETEVSGS